MTKNERAYRRSVKRRAERLGCRIEWDASLKVHWVYGPDEVYQARGDPLEGYRTCCGYGEIEVALDWYGEDLYLHGRGVNADDSRVIREADPPMLAECVARPRDDVSYSVMLDWLADNGHGGVSDRAREVNEKGR